MRRRVGTRREGSKARLRKSYPAVVVPAVTGRLFNENSSVHRAFCGRAERMSRRSPLRPAVRRSPAPPCAAAFQPGPLPGGRRTRPAAAPPAPPLRAPPPRRRPPCPGSGASRALASPSRAGSRRPCACADGRGARGGGGGGGLAPVPLGRRRRRAGCRGAGVRLLAGSCVRGPSGPDALARSHGAVRGEGERKARPRARARAGGGGAAGCGRPEQGPVHPPPPSSRA